MKIDKQIKVRFRLLDHEKRMRKVARDLEKEREKMLHQRSLEAFNRLFELNSATNTYILRSGYED